jgi:hypothetical protein
VLTRNDRDGQRGDARVADGRYANRGAIRTVRRAYLCAGAVRVISSGVANQQIVTTAYPQQGGCTSIASIEFPVPLLAPSTADAENAEMLFTGHFESALPTVYEKGALRLSLTVFWEDLDGKGREAEVMDER